MSEERGLWLPAGAAPVPVGDDARVVIDNRTELPDGVVQEAVETHFVENASLMGVNGGLSFQTYSMTGEGSMLARSHFKTPTNVHDEIRLARDLAERDDDVAAVMGWMLAAAFSDGMENFHEDDKTVQVFNGVAKKANLDVALQELYREWLIAGQVTTVTLFTREQIELDSEGPDEENAAETVNVASPLIGVLHAENIRLLGTDLFGNGDLAYAPGNEYKLAEWLREFFDVGTSPARKAELRRQDPIAAALFIERVAVGTDSALWSVANGDYVYRLNPSMVARSTMPKGMWPHPRPPLARNFALLEAKRLLNIMDFALLQGGSNFIVVAKKGTDDRPAMPEEVQNLESVVRRASRTGVIIGDHRLSFEIITPKLDELLNPAKRKLVGRKLAMALLRVPEPVIEAQSASAQADVEMMARVITADRRAIKRHVERHIYDEVVTRNKAQVKGAPKLWFPKIILQGGNFFTDFVLKLRDRGDIPRKFAVEAGGFDWEAGVAQRKRERAANVDETMAPAAVPFSNPGAGPQDNGPGRPPGSSPNNGAPGARTGPGPDPAAPRQVITRNAGETVRAIRDEEHGVVRVGELTYAILEQYPDREVGRVTALERRALEAGEATVEGPIAVVPVNPGYDVGEVRAVRLAPGLSVLVGERDPDAALVAKALCFRSPEYDPLDAEETALRWGFPVAGWQPQAELEERAQAQAQPLEVHVHVPGHKAVRRVIERDEHGNAIGTREELVETAADTAGLNARQKAEVESLTALTQRFGKMDKGTGANGAHYASPNPFAKQGISCANCVFFDSGACEIVAGKIAPEDVCKFWVIPGEDVKA